MGTNTQDTLRKRADDLNKSLRRSLRKHIGTIQMQSADNLDLQRIQYEYLDSMDKCLSFIQKFGPQSGRKLYERTRGVIMRQASESETISAAEEETLKSFIRRIEHNFAKPPITHYRTVFGQTLQTEIKPAPRLDFYEEHREQPATATVAKENALFVESKPLGQRLSHIGATLMMPFALAAQYAKKQTDKMIKAQLSPRLQAFKSFARDLTRRRTNIAAVPAPLKIPPTFK